MSNRITRLFPSGRRRARVTPEHPKNLKHHVHSALAVGAVVALAGVAATGFTAQSAAAAEATQQATAQLVREAIDQNSDKQVIFEDRTTGEAAAAAATAHTVIAASQGKTDATALTASVTALEQAGDPAPIQLLRLVDQVEADTAAVQGAIAEVDRVAAEAAAAAKAAEAKAAEAAKRTSSSGSSGSAVNVSPGSAQAIARDMMASQYGWGEDQFNCLVKLWQKESRWDVNAYNSSSGATGIPQALPGSKMATAGADWKTNPATQIKWGLGYIAGSYGDPCSAWSTSQAKGWY
jgi:hypothetical protein